MAMRNPFHPIALAIACMLSLSITTASAAQNHASKKDSSRTPAAILKVGQKAPTFFLKTLEGTDFYLRDYVGEPRAFNKSPRKYVLISFFASWCKPCRREIPELEKLVSKYRSDSLAVFLMNAGDDETKINGFLKEVPVKIPVIMDIYGTAANKYCPKEDGDRIVLPTLALIGKDGNILYVHSGYTDGDMNRLEEALIPISK
jgi:thiol-disulfide isomerase/thioredoxin